MDCVCDYGETYDFATSRNQRAAKAHHCYECYRAINRGEVYERFVGKYDGRIDSFAICRHCVAVREYVQAHVPCFCWLYGDMLTSARETVDDYAHEAPGLRFGLGRLLVAARGAARCREATR